MVSVTLTGTGAGVVATQSVSSLAGGLNGTAGYLGEKKFDTAGVEWKMIWTNNTVYYWKPDGYPTANAEYVSRYDAALGKIVYKAIYVGTTPSSTSANQTVTTAILGGVGVEGLLYRGVVRNATGTHQPLPISLSTTTDAVLADSYVIYTGVNVAITFKLNAILTNKPFVAEIEYTR